MTDSPHWTVPTMHPGRTGPRRNVHLWRRRWRFGRVGLLVGGLAVSGLLAAACTAGSTSPGVASLGSTSTTSGTHGSTSGSTTSSALAFAHCMQTHGVPDFPDPNATGQTQIQGGPTSDLNPSSSAFQKAQSECRTYAPHHHLSPAQQHAAEAEALKFSQCMRAHGVPDFPDPTVTGTGIGISIKGGPGSTPNLNPKSPTFQAAQKACQKDMPGKGKGTRTAHGPSGSGSGSGSGSTRGTTSGGGA